MTLPGLVNSAGMKPETNGDRLTVILPNADQPALSRN
ncbi:MAG: hypothetical protein JWM59_316 [Verrucomicrobiales bacterium]|nr:hypothetical protein [Verrucomicrobiales bacterium]